MILVTGGAGYIGSHVVKALQSRNLSCMVVDNLSAGSRGAVGSTIPFANVDIGNVRAMERIFKAARIETVIHLAASISPEESMSNPEVYYKNNTVNSLLLWNLCAKYRVKHVIFSSTAAVYGNISSKKAIETDPVAPLSPYGRSKHMAEQMLRDIALRNKFTYVIFRYFNVIGCDPMLPHFLQRKEYHLLKVCLDVACGDKKFVPVYGMDYPTVDGTGVRDYIHVNDIASAHISALSYLRKKGTPGVYNVGYGKGTSVLAMIRAVQKVTGRKIVHKSMPRRPGDPVSVVADATKITRQMKWKPGYNDMEQTIRQLWNQKNLKQ